MALTRARVIAGSKHFNGSVKAIREILIRPRNPLQLKNDILSMRQRLASEKRKIIHGS